MDLNCKGKVPILALLEESSVLDQFEVLALGAVDYLELPYLMKLIRKKFRNFISGNGSIIGGKECSA